MATDKLPFSVLQALVAFHLKDGMFRLGLDMDGSLAHTKRQLKMDQEEFDLILGTILAKRLDLEDLGLCKVAADPKPVKKRKPAGTKKRNPV